MKQFFLSILFLSFLGLHSQNTIVYSDVAQNLLQNIIDKKSYDKEIQLLSESTLTNLVDELQTDEQKITFWVNIYNAFIQISLTENPKLYEDRSAFFSDNRVKIAGEVLSFDDIEHGILRKSRIKISLGYLRKWFRPKWERKLRIDGKIDWRIHFALNCGAKSCPPVAVYDAKKLDKQFDFMTTKYLNENTDFNAATKVATSVALFSWFRGDFGGKSGAKKILFNYKITLEKPKKIKFKRYDWTLSLGDFRELPQF